MYFFTDVRLKKFIEERNELMDELRHVKLELEEERSRSRGHRVNSLNGPHSDDIEDIQSMYTSVFSLFQLEQMNVCCMSRFDVRKVLISELNTF